MRPRSLKSARNKRAGKSAMDAWRAAQTEICAVCWSDGKGRELHQHHLVGGFGRRDVPENLLLLCQRCHGHYHGEKRLGRNGQRLPDLTPGMLLTCKHEADVKHFSLAVICILKGWKALPENWCPQPIPAPFIRERERNQT